jgi:hypothetical protein
MTSSAALRILRTFFGVLPIVAIGWQFDRHLSHGFSAVNFFSYFTVQFELLGKIRSCDPRGGVVCSGRRCRCGPWRPGRGHARRGRRIKGQAVRTGLASWWSDQDNPGGRFPAALLI